MQAIQADIRENERKREKRRRSRRKEKNTPPSFLPELLSTKNHPPKKVCGPYIKFVYFDVRHRPEPSLFPFWERKAADIKKEILFIKNFWSDVFLSQKRRRDGGLKRSHQKKTSEKGRRRETESPVPKLPRCQDPREIINLNGIYPCHSSRHSSF